MCESKVVVLRDGKKETLMEEAVKMIFSQGSVTLIDIIGLKKVVDGVKIKEANLVDHEMVLEEI